VPSVNRIPGRCLSSLARLKLRIVAPEDAAPENARARKRCVLEVTRQSAPWRRVVYPAA